MSFVFYLHVDARRYVGWGVPGWFKCEQLVSQCLLLYQLCGWPIEVGTPVKYCLHLSPLSRALCRIILLPVTRVLVDAWMLIVKPVYKLSNKCVWWPEMGYKHTYDTIYTHFQGITNNIYGFGRPFLLLHFLPVHPYFYPSIFVFIFMSKWRVDGSLHKAMPTSECQ